MESCGAARASLDQQQFDVAVIGGGINGVAIARECALAGRSVLLVEKHDIASGTTSRSTRLIHGGLRYLEHGDLRLVRESLRERERLLRDRPHLVRPTQFVLAMPANGTGLRSPLAIRLGLMLYHHWAGSPALHEHSGRKTERLLAETPGLRLFSYEDAQCEFPERLTAEWMMEAVQRGAIVRNHCEVLQIEVQDGRAAGLRYRDRLSGEEGAVSARWIVNASGPWADMVCGNVATRRLVGGVKGSHIILSRWPGAPQNPIYSEAPDGRKFFVVPWADQLLVGTTEVAHEGDPADARVTTTEIEYLLASLLKLLPHAPVTRNDIRGTYSGVRALPYSPGAPQSSITRRSIIHDHLEDGVAHLLTIIGGKLTTAASLARECAHKMGMRLPAREPLVAIGCGNGVASALRHWTGSVARTTPLKEATVLGLAEWHGRSASCIVRLASSSPEMRHTLCPHSAHIAAEAFYAIECERAATLADVLLRRVPVALGACWSDDCTQHAADAVARVLGWSERTKAAQIEAFRHERTTMLGVGVAASNSIAPDLHAHIQAQAWN